MDWIGIRKIFSIIVVILFCFTLDQEAHGDSEISDQGSCEDKFEKAFSFPENISNQEAENQFNKWDQLITGLVRKIVPKGKLLGFEESDILTLVQVSVLSNLSQLNNSVSLSEQASYLRQRVHGNIIDYFRKVAKDQFGVSRDLMGKHKVIKKIENDFMISRGILPTEAELREEFNKRLNLGLSRDQFFNILHRINESGPMLSFSHDPEREGRGGDSFSIEDQVETRTRLGLVNHRGSSKQIASLIDRLGGEDLTEFERDTLEGFAVGETQFSKAQLLALRRSFARVSGTEAWLDRSKNKQLFGGMNEISRVVFHSDLADLLLGENADVIHRFYFSGDSLGAISKSYKLSEAGVFLRIKKILERLELLENNSKQKNRRNQFVEVVKNRIEPIEFVDLVYSLNFHELFVFFKYFILGEKHHQIALELEIFFDHYELIFRSLEEKIARFFPDKKMMSKKKDANRGNVQRLMRKAAELNRLDHIVYGRWDSSQRKMFSDYVFENRSVSEIFMSGKIGKKQIDTFIKKGFAEVLEYFLSNPNQFYSPRGYNVELVKEIDSSKFFLFKEEELFIIGLIKEGLSIAETSVKLGKSERTIEKKLSLIVSRLGQGREPQSEATTTLRILLHLWHRGSLAVDFSEDKKITIQSSDVESSYAHLLQNFGYSPTKLALETDQSVFVSRARWEKFILRMQETNTAIWLAEAALSKKSIWIHSFSEFLLEKVKKTPEIMGRLLGELAPAEKKVFQARLGSNKSYAEISVQLSYSHAATATLYYGNALRKIWNKHKELRIDFFVFTEGRSKFSDPFKNNKIGNYGIEFLDDFPSLGRRKKGMILNELLFQMMKEEVIRIEDLKKILTERELNMVISRFVDHLSDQEIAKKYNMKPTTVRSALTFARKRLISTHLGIRERYIGTLKTYSEIQ